MSDTVSCLSYSLWLTSLRVLISRSIRVAANGIILFFFYGWVIFHWVRVCVCLNLSLCIYTHTDTHHLFFIHLSLDGHSDCFHVLAIVNCAAINNGVHVSFWIMIFSGSSVLKSNYSWDSQCKGFGEVGVLLGMSLKIKYSHLRRHL